jgi:cytochrome P450
MYIDELAAEICQRIADGETMTAIAREPHMPTRETVRVWRRDRPAFSAAFARARVEGMEALADDIVSISDDRSGDVQRDRLRVDTRKFLMSKIAPHVYGDKLEHSGTVTMGHVQITDTPLTAEQWAEKYTRKPD